MKDLANRDHVIVYLAAKGLKNSEIAQSVGLDPSTVRAKLADERIQFEIKHLRYKLYGKDHKKRFQDILPHAMDVTEEILKNPNAKPQLRFQAAQEVMDRALGKPKQTVEHEGSLIRDLFEKLDGTKAVTSVIDVESVEVLEDKAVAILENPNSKTQTVTTNNPNFDTVDEWVKNNL